MTKVIKALDHVEPWSFLENDQLLAAARELFVKLPMARAFDDDYENAVALLREVYDRGRSRGAYEAEGGARC